MDVFKVDLRCDFEELWRYNIVVMADVTLDGERVEVVKLCDEVAPVGAELTLPPAGYSRTGEWSLSSKPADALTLYIYIIPHTLPRHTRMEDVSPFNLLVDVSHGGKRVYRHHHEINQWSGENLMIPIEIKERVQ